MGASLLAANVQAAEQDVNKDGLVDLIDVRVQAAGLAGYPVHSVKLVMTFNYQLNVRPPRRPGSRAGPLRAPDTPSPTPPGSAVRRRRAGACGAGHEIHRVPAARLPGARQRAARGRRGALALAQRGRQGRGRRHTRRAIPAHPRSRPQLVLRQRNALLDGSMRAKYTSDLVNWARSAADLRGAAELQLATLFSAYLDRNETTVLQAEHPIWVAGQARRHGTAPLPGGMAAPPLPAGTRARAARAAPRCRGINSWWMFVCASRRSSRFCSTRTGSRWPSSGGSRRARRHNGSTVAAPLMRAAARGAVRAEPEPRRLCGAVFGHPGHLCAGGHLLRLRGFPLPHLPHARGERPAAQDAPLLVPPPRRRRGRET